MANDQWLKANKNGPPKEPFLLFRLILFVEVVEKFDVIDIHPRGVATRKVITIARAGECQHKL